MDKDKKLTVELTAQEAALIMAASSSNLNLFIHGLSEEGNNVLLSGLHKLAYAVAQASDKPDAMARYMETRCKAEAAGKLVPLPQNLN